MPAKSPTRRHLSSIVAALERHHPGDPRIPELRAELVTEGLAEVIAKGLGSAPPLNPAQRSRLVRVLYTGLAGGRD